VIALSLSDFTDGLLTSQHCTSDWIVDGITAIAGYTAVSSWKFWKGASYKRFAADP
jgi:hypothetical protein